MINNSIYNTLFKKALLQNQYIDIQNVLNKNSQYFNEVLEEYIVIDRYEEIDNYVLVESIID